MCVCVCFCVCAVPGGAAICHTVATFGGCWWVLRTEAPLGPERDLAVPGGAATCDAVATSEGCWWVLRAGRGI
eukprot:4550693-Pyramimonas_sp.AAC.1